MIDVSVVVATYNRMETIKVTLSKLAEQTYPAEKFEVIVLDDGSPDETGETVNSMIEKVPYSLRYLHHANRGPGATQNRGIREAKGRIVVLMADDIHATPEMLEGHMQFHSEHPGAHFACLARVLQSPDLPKTLFMRNWDPFRYVELEGIWELPYWKFWACNISVKRDFLLANGLYRELKGAAHEDVELGYRLSRKGLRIFYNPQILAYHYHFETLDRAVTRAYERGLNWRFIEENVPDPQIYVKYHILSWHTLNHHFETLKPGASNDLPAEDRFWPWLLFRQFVRSTMFNRVTVPHFWLPFLKRAEQNRLLGSLVNPYFYRGAVFYHFVRGAADSRKMPPRTETVRV